MTRCAIWPTAPIWATFAFADGTGDPFLTVCRTCHLMLQVRASTGMRLMAAPLGAAAVPDNAGRVDRSRPGPAVPKGAPRAPAT